MRLRSSGGDGYLYVAMAKAKKKTESATEALRELFGVAPTEFIKERNALASKLKSERRDAEAKEVKAIKKPPTPAYLVNLVAHRYPADVKAMLEAGEAVEDAQRNGRTEELHERGAEHRALISSLLDRAEAIADEVGIGFNLGLKSKVETAFRVATASDADRAAVETGTLTQELQPTGFDALFAGGGIRAPKTQTVSARTAKKEKAADARALKAARKELQRAKKAQAAVEARARKTQAELAASSTKLERAQARVAALEASR